MYIDPFWAGVLVTLLIESVATVVCASITGNLKKMRRENDESNNHKDNSNEPGGGED